MVTRWEYDQLSLEATGYTEDELGIMESDEFYKMLAKAGKKSGVRRDPDGSIYWGVPKRTAEELEEWILS